MLADGLQELIQVLRGRKRVDEGHAQGADAIQTGGNQVKVTRFNDPAPQLKLKAAELVGRDGGELLGDVAGGQGITISEYP
jgi:hypothetical protein